MSHPTTTPANSEARAVELYRCAKCDAELDHPGAHCDHEQARQRSMARLNEAIERVAQLASSAMDDVAPNRDGTYTLDAEGGRALLKALAIWSQASTDFMDSL